MRWGLRRVATLPLAAAFGAVAILSLSGSLDTALATKASPPTVTCSATQCETCLEYSGAGNRCLKCTRIERCLIDKGGGGPKSPIARYGRATNDVDIYDSPVAPRKIIGMMRVNEEGPVMELHRDGWAKLLLPATPDFQRGGNGWVANDHLKFVIEK